MHLAVHLWMTDTDPKGKGFPGEKNGKLGKNMTDIHHGVQEMEREREYPKAQRKPGHPQGVAGGIWGARSGCVASHGSVRRRWDLQQIHSINTECRGSGAGRRCPTPQV